MHFHFTTLCVAFAACRVSGSLAAPSRSIAKSPRSLREVPTKKHSGSDKLESDEEERSGNIPREFEEIVGGKRGSLVTDSKLTDSKFMNAWNQVLEPLDDRYKRRELLDLVNHWDRISHSYEDEWEKATNVPKKVSMKAWKEKWKNSKDETKTLKKFLNDRKPKAFEIESSTKRLQDWLKKEGSLDTLFTVLGLHEAMDRAANGLLISMNLERWNFVMKYLDKTGHYNLKDSLQETLTALCGNEKWATLFLERLVFLRDTTNKDQLKWLHEMRKPEDICDEMKIDKDNLLTGSKLANEWIAYWATYNDLYPQSRTPLNAVVPGFEIAWIQKNLPKGRNYPSQGVQRQIVGDILKSWADAKPPLSPFQVFNHFKNPESPESSVPLSALKNYLNLIKFGMQPDEQSAVKKLKTSLNKLLNVRLRSNPEEIKLFYDRLKALDSKNLFKRKPESPPENARDRQRSRGE